MNNSRPRSAGPWRARSMESPSGATGAHTINSQSARTRYEQYLVLAAAKALIGDRIEAENYYQHAEHCLRSMAKGTN